MSRLLPVLALSTGCFYVDPINQRPSIEISTAARASGVARRCRSRSTARRPTPRARTVKFTWRAYACTDGDHAAGCDQMPYDGSDCRRSRSPSRSCAPISRIDVTRCRVVLEGSDDHGATAKPEPVLVIPIGDAPPVLEVGKVRCARRYVDQHAGHAVREDSDPDDDVGAGRRSTGTCSRPRRARRSRSTTPAPIRSTPSTSRRRRRSCRTAAGKWTIAGHRHGSAGRQTVAHIVMPTSPPIRCRASRRTIRRDARSASPPLPLSDPKLFSVLARHRRPRSVSVGTRAIPCSARPTFHVVDLLAAGRDAFTQLERDRQRRRARSGAYTVGDSARASRRDRPIATTAPSLPALRPHVRVERRLRLHPAPDLARGGAVMRASSFASCSPAAAPAAPRPTGSRRRERWLPVPRVRSIPITGSPVAGRYVKVTGDQAYGTASDYGVAGRRRRTPTTTARPELDGSAVGFDVRPSDVTTRQRASTAARGMHLRQRRSTSSTGTATCTSTACA